MFLGSTAEGESLSRTFRAAGRHDSELLVCTLWEQALAYLAEGIGLAVASQSVPTRAGEVDGAQCLAFLRRWGRGLKHCVLLAPRSLPSAVPAEMEVLPLEAGSPHLMERLQACLPAPPRLGPSELVVCDPDGEIVRAENSRDPERRSDLLAFLAHKSQVLAQTLGEQPLEALHLRGPTGEARVVLSSERQWFAARKAGEQARLDARDADVEVVWSVRR